jgi:hypothetical protein
MPFQVVQQNRRAGRTLVALPKPEGKTLERFAYAMAEDIVANAPLSIAS